MIVKNKYYLPISYLLMIIGLCFKTVIAIPIDQPLLYNTILIEVNDSRGTGFLVKHEIEPGQFKIYLVTNKHVIAESTMVDSLDGIKYYKYKYYNNITIGYKSKTDEWKTLTCTNIRNSFLPHNDPFVDVAVIDITFVVMERDLSAMVFMPIEHILSKEDISEHNIDIGDEVFIIGYPRGWRNMASNDPLLISGIVSTRLDKKLSLEIQQSKGVKIENLDAFLINANIYGGMSGSPVILKRRNKINKDGSVDGRYFIKNYVLGIVSGSFLIKHKADTFNLIFNYIPPKVVTLKTDPKGEYPLGVVFTSKCILECIKQFEDRFETKEKPTETTKTRK